MTRIASKFGIAAALTLGMAVSAAAQSTPVKPTTTVPLGKETTTSGGEVVKPDTVTVFVHDTVTNTVFRRDTITVAGPTVTRFDTVSIVSMPGWLDAGRGLYFGLGAGTYFPSAGLSGGQEPGGTVQMNLGIDPAGSPLGLRITAAYARPIEEQTGRELGGTPRLFNTTADLKLRLPVFSRTRFPQLSLYAVGGGAYVMYKNLRVDQSEGPPIVTLADASWHDKFGWNAGGGAALAIGHKREIFLEARAINFRVSGFESPHQMPLVLGVNWY